MNGADDPMLALIETIEGDLTAIAAELCSIEQSSLAPTARFSELGLDSAMVLRLTAVLNARYGTSLSPTLFFEYPTTRALATHLAETYPAIVARLSRTHAETGRAEDTRPAAPRSPTRRGVAVIGMAGRFPGAADIATLWENLLAGHDPIRAVPAQRWDLEAAGATLDADQASRARWAGFIDGVDAFDPLFFGISPKEARAMDPQQRLLLQCAWEAIEDAGCAPSRLAGSDTGVFVACGSSDYPALVAASGAAVESFTSIGLMASAAPNRISHFLDLRGPSEAIETACSSSLVCVHRAMSAIFAGECETALAGGVNTLLASQNHTSLSLAGALSPSGRCSTFSEQADGYVRSEGVAVLLLKELSAAERDGDAIYGVLLGSAVNHGGRAASLTAPNPRAQAELIKKAQANAGVDPSSISYLEAHGTGTQLGDPIEIAGMKAAFARNGKLEGGVRQRCGLGSIKSNIGHLELVAGVAGLIKVLLQMKHQRLVGMANFTRQSPHIDLSDSPFYIVESNQPWRIDAPAGETGRRRAGVSSFSVTGTNAHVVVEEYVAPAATTAVPPAGDGFSIVLSARDRVRLREQAARLAAALRRERYADADLFDLAHTLQHGRDAMAERVGFVVDAMQELLERLDAFAVGAPGAGTLWLDRSCAAASTLQAAHAAGGRDEELHRVARWTRGEQVAWPPAGAARPPRRLRLPTYPFARCRSWIAATAPSDLAGLLRHETKAGSFTFRLTGAEFYLRDHVVGGQRMLPGVVYLMLAHAAVDALHARDPLAPHAAAAIELRDVVWLAPVVVEQAPVVLNIECESPADGVAPWLIYSTTNSGERLVHAQGRSGFATSEPRTGRAELEAAQARCSAHRFERDACYSAFERLGIRYGAAHRVVDCIHVGANELVAAVKAPEARRDDATSMRLHPALLDGATQAVIGFALAAAAAGGPDLQLALPFEVAAVRCLQPCHDARYVSITRGNSCGPQVAFDIDIFAANGTLLAQLHGFSLRSRNGSETVQVAPGNATLVPVWKPVSVAPSAHAWSTRAGTWVIGGAAADRSALGIAAPMPRLPRDVQEWRAAIQAQGRIEHIVWLAARANHALDAGDDMLQAQQDGVFSAFRLLHALFEEGYATRELRWTVVTFGAAAVSAAEPIDPTHAAMHGLMGVVAKELANWRVRVVDWSARLALDPVQLDAAVSAAYELVAYREQRWFRPQLEASPSNAPAPAALQSGDVCIVIGGAGGIGAAWAEQVLRDAAVQFVWIGRRPLDASIQAKLDGAARLGPRPRYVCADAGDAAQLQAVRSEVQREFGRIDAVVHAAVVLADSTLANMSEQDFRVAFEAKANTALRVAQVFAQDRLKFVLFFSAFAALARNAGQANYVAAGVFADALAQALALRSGARVRALNWGYWGSVGVAATDYHRARMHKLGWGSVEAPEAKSAIDRIVAGDGVQAAFVSMLRQARVDGLTLVVPDAPAGGATADVAIDVGSGHDPLRLTQQAREDAIEILLRELREFCAHVLEIDPVALNSTDRPFSECMLGEFGMDSLSATTLRARLQKHYGVDIRVQTIIGQPPRRIADELYELLLLKTISAHRIADEHEARETFVL